MELFKHLLTYTLKALTVKYVFTLLIWQESLTVSWSFCRVMKEALIPAPGSQPRELNIFILSHVKCRKRFVVTENCVGQCTVFTAYIYTPRDFVEGYQSRTDIRENKLASSASCQNSVQSSFHLQYSGTTRAEWFCFTLQISTQTSLFMGRARKMSSAWWQ